MIMKDNATEEDCAMGDVNSSERNCNAFLLLRLPI